MNWEEFLREEKDLLALVGALGSPDPEALALKVAYSKILLANLPAGRMVPWDSVLDILEDLQLNLSERKTRQILVTSGLATEAVDGLRVPSNIRIERSFPQLTISDSEMSKERFVGLLSLRRGGDTSTVSSVDLGDCLLALDRTNLWGAEVAANVQAAGLDGVPVFWTCEGDLHAPFSPDPGTLATADTLLLILERSRHRLPLLELDGDQVEAVLWLWKKLLSMQRQDEDWNRGAFSVPTWDDDFVGSYLAEYEELGPCPTVDATGNAVVALSVALRSRLARVLKRGLRRDLEQRTREAITLGVEFLLRNRADDGYWSIYRYEDDRFTMPPRDISSRFAMEGLAEATISGVLASSLVHATSQAASRYLAWVRRTVRRAGEECSWVPDFTRPFAREDEKLQASATIGLTLCTMARAWPEFNEEIESLGRGTVRFIERVWEPNEERFVRIAFRVPTWAGPAETKFPWEMPLDPMAVSMLLTGEGAVLKLESSTRAQIERAVAGFLNSEKHGHWVDFLMKKEGKDRGMPGNTIHYHRALLDYLSWQARLLAPLFGSARSGRRSATQGGGTADSYPQGKD